MQTNSPNVPAVVATATSTVNNTNAPAPKKRRVTGPRPKRPNPIDSLPEDNAQIDDDSATENTSSQPAPEQNLVIDTTPSQPRVAGTTRKRLTTKAAVQELIQLETQKRMMIDEIKKITELTKRCEAKLVDYMLKNDVIKIAVTDSSFLEMRQRQRREKPKSAMVLARLTQMLAAGERDPKVIFDFIRAPILKEKSYTLSKRKTRKPRAPGSYAKKSVNNAGVAAVIAAAVTSST